MQEVFLGLDSDREYIQSYLENIRRLDLVEITTLPNAVHFKTEYKKYFMCVRKRA